MPTEQPEPRPPVGVAIDADLGVRADAVLAVALLNGLTAKQEARRISLSVSRPSLNAARLADVIAEFYPTMPINSGFLTIGMLDGAMPRADAPAVERMLAAKTPDGASVYESRVRRLIDTADNATLIRNMLLAQHDGNAIVVLAGAATGLARLLDLYGARPQIEAKVKRLVIALGAYPAGKADPSVLADVAAARRLLSDWPTPLVVVGSEVGEAVRFPFAKLDEGLAWFQPGGSPTHPIAAACRAISGKAQDMPTTALAAVSYAIHPEAAEFGLSEPGTISVLDDGRTRFVPGAGGRHRYLIAPPAQRGALLASYASLVSAQTAPRPIRRSNQQNQQNLPNAPAANSPAANAPGAAANASAATPNAPAAMPNAPAAAPKSPAAAPNAPAAAPATPGGKP